MNAHRPFHIKICGITRAADAHCAADAGADAIGINFWPGSRRYLRPAEAQKIAAELPARVARVGVFVNATIEQVATTASEVGLDWIQLHGDEPPSLLAMLPRQLPILRAFRCGAQGLAPLAAYLADSSAHGRSPDAVLIDADATSDFGGTGRRADWMRIARERALLGAQPLILAGGLTLQNVAAAIEAVQPTGVDVASGVECAPGIKDPALIEKFVITARTMIERHPS
jgi:phosphoribosylanthranilate isomerase